MIENVLKMMNAPTNRAMKAKTSRAVRKNPSPSFKAFDCSSATVADVTASTPSGSTDWISARSSLAATLSSPTTLIVSKTPSLPSTRCAVVVSKIASVAPARLSASPNERRPEIVNSPVALREEDLDLVADGQVVLLRGRRVDRDVVRARSVGCPG